MNDKAIKKKLHIGLFKIGFSQVVAKFSFEGETGNNVLFDSISYAQFTIVNHYSKPERIPGIVGNTLQIRQRVLFFHF